MIPTTVTLKYDKPEIKTAVADYLGHRLGSPLGKNCHPLAEELMYSRSTVAECANLVDLLGPRAGYTPSQILDRAMHGQTDFLYGVERASRAALTARFESGLSNFIAFTKEVEVSGFQNSYYPIVDFPSLPANTAEAESNKFLRIGTSGETVKASLRTTMIGISRELLVNDDVSVLSSGLQAAANAAIKTEHQGICTLLNANAALRDGSDWFNTVDSSLIASGTLNADGLDTAFGYMAAQVGESTEYVAAVPRYLLVNSDKQATAATLAAAMFPALELAVIPSPWLTSGHYYLVADPEQNPCVGRIVLASAMGETMEVEAVRPRFAEDVSSDGVFLRIRLAAGASALSRRGILKVTL